MVGCTLSEFYFNSLLISCIELYGSEIFSERERSKVGKIFEVRVIEHFEAGPFSFVIFFYLSATSNNLFCMIAAAIVGPILSYYTQFFFFIAKRKERKKQLKIIRTDYSYSWTRGGSSQWFMTRISWTWILSLKDLEISALIFRLKR